MDSSRRTRRAAAGRACAVLAALGAIAACDSSRPQKPKTDTMPLDIVSSAVARHVVLMLPPAPVSAAKQVSLSGARPQGAELKPVNAVAAHG